MITSEWPTPDNPYLVPFVVRQVKYLRLAGIDLHLLPFRGGKNPVNYARAWKQAQHLLKVNNFDLVHAQWGQSGLLALPKRVPLVVTFRGDDLEGIVGAGGKKTGYGLILKTVSRMVARAANQIILVSESLSVPVKSRPIHVIPSGLDLKLFYPADKTLARKKLGLHQERRYVLFAGAATNPRKRVWLAEQAVDLLKSEMDVELLTATNILHDQVPDYMNASDVMVLVSMHEGSPNVVKEALACNLPVVSTDVGDVRQRIGHIPGCVVLEHDDPNTIANALRTVLQRGERIDGRSTVLNLDENIMTKKVINVYQQALSSR
jgi:teichuronic acid biosynthesis glycosyltransferase TuaC